MGEYDTHLAKLSVLQINMELHFKIIFHNTKQEGRLWNRSQIPSLKWKGIVSSCNNSVSFISLIQDFPEHKHICKSIRHICGTLVNIKTGGLEDTSRSGLHLKEGISGLLQTYLISFCILLVKARLNRAPTQQSSPYNSHYLSPTTACNSSVQFLCKSWALLKLRVCRNEYFQLN